MNELNGVIEVGFLDELLGLSGKKNDIPTRPISEQKKPSAPTNKSEVDKGNGRDKHNWSLEDELELGWEYVQKRLCCYELPYPQITNSAKTDTACIDMTNHQISIRKSFLGHLASKGLGNQTALKGLLLHEAGHYKVIPWDLKNLIMMLYKAQQVCGDGKTKDIVTNYFMDVCVNLDMTLDKREDSIRQIYKALDKNSRIDLLLSHLYDFKAGNVKTGCDFGSPRLPSELEPRLKELKKIKFTSRRRTYSNLKRFAEVVKDLIEDEQDQSQPSYNRLDDFGLKAYDKREIERALKEVAREMESPSNYKKIYKFVKDEQKNQRAENKQGAGGNDRKENSANDKKGKENMGAGKRDPDNQGYDPKDALIQFYTTKAEAYEISVEDKSVLGGGEAFKSEFKPWEVDDPYLNVDVFNSYGRFIPEISKSWKDTGATGEKVTQATPDLLVMVDSSSSMANPAEELSYAALGGLCAARQYLKKGSKVAVVNFGDHTKVADFSTDYRKISEKMLHYQAGGTELLNDRVYELISKHNKEVDIMLMSDGFIYNYEQVMSGLTSKKNTHRVTILEIIRYNILGGFSGGSERFKSERIQVYPISSDADIPKVVVNDLKSRGVM